MSRPMVARGIQAGAATGAAAAALGIAFAGGSTFIAWLAAIAVGAAGGAVAGALAFAGPDGVIAAVAAAARRVADGREGEPITARSAAAGDLSHAFNAMTDRLDAAFAARAAEQARLVALFETSTDAILALSADTKVRLMNAAAERLIGEGRANVLGRSVIESCRDHEVDALVRKTIASGRPNADVITFGPLHIPLRVSATPIERGGDWSVLLVLADLTEMRRFEQARRDFVSNVSHELRTPLASLKAMVETIDDRDLGAPGELQEFIARIHREVDRLVALVNELLDLSRIESGVERLERGPVDVAEAAAEAARVIEPLAASRHVGLDLPEPGVIANADRRALVRILTNLLENAVRFSPEGTRVVLSTSSQGESVEITVTDSGPGLSEGDLQRVFERFFKATHSRADPGTGLGLAIVKHLVRAHGGTVEARSKLGEGAQFVVRLPTTAGS